MNDLLAQAQEGDMQAFAELFEPLRGTIFAVACRLVGPTDAEDVVMDTYLRAWKALPAFDRRSALGTWLCRIAGNRAKDLLRLRRHTVDLPPGTRPEDPPEESLPDDRNPGPDEEVMQAEERAMGRRALDSLPDIYRQVLLLRHADGLSYAQIAAATGVHLGTVMSRLFHARRRLNAAMSAGAATGTGERHE